MDRPIRVRYAPSPTGPPHIGNIRTALFNWLFARHYGGRFILRIEDTDVSRQVPGSVEAILDSLRWLGLDWDEGPEVGGGYGPYFQSQRLGIYQERVQELLEQGFAYRCYCSPERLSQMRAEQMRLKQPPRYDRLCRLLTEAQRRDKEVQGIVPVVRFKTPLEGQTAFHDLIRGAVVFDNANLDDLVLLKSDGFPTYHLANVVDDHLMDISHVLRADEWISSTPRHILLYRAFGYDPPQFAHLPIILGSDGAKLSKRHGATSVIAFRDEGYLPQAILNFLVLLGWSLDDRTEIFSREELVEHFTIERVGKTAAIFSLEKLEWMNGVYIRRASVEQLAHYITPFLESGLPQQIRRPLSQDYILRIIPLIQDRLKKLKGVVDLTEFFFVDTLSYDANRLLGKDLTHGIAIQALKAAIEDLAQCPSFSEEVLESILRPLAEKLGLKTGPFFGLLRVAITGRTAAPPLFQTMAVLGKERVMKRLGKALEILDAIETVRR